MKKAFHELEGFLWDAGFLDYSCRTQPNRLKTEMGQKLSTYGHKHKYVCEICGRIVHGDQFCSHTKAEEKASDRATRGAETRDERYGFSGRTTKTYGERLEDGFQKMVQRAVG